MLTFFKSGVVAAAVLAILFFSACGTIPVSDADKQLQVPETARTFVFNCDDGFGFVARISDAAWLFLPSGTVEAKQTADHTYQSEQVTFRLTGQSASLESPQGSHSDCQNDRRQAIWEHAKLNGADFRAIGNEPGWNLEILNQSQLVLVSSYGAERYEFDLPEPQIDQNARTTRYDIVQDGQRLVVTISGQMCLDSMSGEEFASSVEVSLNGRVLRGCGKALH